MSAHLIAAAPNWAEAMTGIGSLLAGFGVVVASVAGWFAYAQLRETRRDRHILVISEFGRRWDTRRVAKARDMQTLYTGEQIASEIEEWRAKPREKQHIGILLRVPNFFEDLAIIVGCGKLDIELVARAMGTIISNEWLYWEAAIMKMQEGRPESYKEFQQLAHDIQLHAECRSERRKREARWQQRRSVFTEGASRRSSQ